MAEHPKNPAVMSRRAFIAGIAAVPIAAKAALAIPAPVSIPAPAVVTAPLTLSSFSNCNMMQGWQWSFDLVRARDGSLTLLSTQTMEDPNDDPWEIDPAEELHSGADIFDAMRCVYEEVSSMGVEDIGVEDVASRLETLDPDLAKDFLRAASEYLGGDDVTYDDF